MSTKFEHLNVDLSRPVCFLDLDGVINNNLRRFDWYRESCGYKTIGNLDYYMESILNPLANLLQAFNTQLIIVSSWMHSYETNKTFKAKIIADLFGCDVLGSINTGPGRSTSITECVKHFSIENWFTIDDSHQMYTGVDFDMSRLICIDGRYGVQTKDLDKIHHMLLSFK